MKKTGIIAKNIHKSYFNGKITTHVLKGISLEVKPGEFLAIMGKSGAGKSTLLYQISLLDAPTRGSISIEGVDVLALSENEATDFRLNNLAYIFQDYALVPELTAIENVMIPLLSLGNHTQQAKDLASRALVDVGLDGKQENLPSQLSGGQQQRVSIARAIAQNPSVLFADEPTANLDTVSSFDVLRAMKALHDQGQTIVMVTHEREYANFADRIIFMEDGLVVKEVKPKKK